MSWQAATLLILALALVGGFAWYERSRPPSQVIALVAALAAVAIAGRIALAAVPNLVATTDIVLFAGYALGPAPGFAVGAIAGLVSNFWLGQGPWTPWQMAGWGGVGLLGALLAVLAGGRVPGRLVLGVTCGFAAICFGLLMNFSTMASFGGEASLERFAALQVRAIPFDLMHVAGNVLLAVIAGPAILRMLGRFRRRFSWTRTEPAPTEPAPGGEAREPGARGAITGGRAAVVVGALLACLSPALLPGEARAASLDTRSAVAWLGSVQNADGGFGPSPGDESSVITTGWTVMGLAAAGVHAEDMRARGRNSPIDFIRRNVGQVRSTGDIARTVLALNAAGVEPRRFAGRNLISDLRGRMRSDGSFEGWPGTTAFAIMALRLSGSPGGLRRSVAWLRQAQGRDGGWGPTPGARSDPDTTGAVLQAIGGSAVIKRGVGYLRRAQRPSGGFPLGGTSTVNSQSTAWAMQGLIAVGLNPDRFGSAERSPSEALAALQMPDGHFRYSAASDQTPTWVTASVLPAATGQSYPIAEPPRRPRPEPRPIEPRPPQAGLFPEHVPPPPSPGGGGGFGGAGAAPARPAPGPGAGGGIGPPGRDGDGRFEPQPVDPDAVGSRPRGPDRSDSPAGGRDAGAPGSDGLEPIPLDLDGEVGPVATTRPGPSPAAPAGIGMGLAGLTIGGMWWLGRRRAW